MDHELQEPVPEVGPRVEDRDATLGPAATFAGDDPRHRGSGDSSLNSKVNIRLRLMIP